MLVRGRAVKKALVADKFGAERAQRALHTKHPTLALSWYGYISISISVLMA
ncbi:hypothetical protein ACMFMG_011024 [Clarireedia jacksonii]